MSMNPVDPKWLEILKATGWQTGALTIACTVILLLVRIKAIPTNGSLLWITIPVIGIIIFGSLTFTTIINSLVKAIKPSERFIQWRLKNKKKKEVCDFIPFMTDTDRKIIGYLLYHNQKIFQTTQDGGYAAPLISKGIIQPSINKSGQYVDITRIPFEIPNHIWHVLEKNRDSFPYTPPRNGEVEKHPWAISWKAR